MDFVLETLAVIAWQAPILQSEVVNIRQNKAYEHISELIELGFIKKEPEGRSYRISLTEKFFEYFDVEGGKDIRKIFQKVAEPDQTKVDDFNELTEKLPDWYLQGAAFLEQEAPSTEFGELDQSKENDDEEFSEL